MNFDRVLIGNVTGYNISSHVLTMSFSVLAMQNFIYLYLNPTKSEITSHKNVFKLVCQTCIKNNKSERKKHYYLSHIKQVLYRVLLHTVFPISSGERHFFEFKSIYCTNSNANLTNAK